MAKAKATSSKKEETPVKKPGRKLKATKKTKAAKLAYYAGGWSVQEVKQPKILRVPKKMCPHCGEEFEISRNGYDVIHRGTDREKKITRYLCRSCDKTFQERNYISPGRLMARQSVILWLLGWDYQTIAKQLNITPITVKRHVLSLIKYEKAVVVRQTEYEEAPITRHATIVEVKILKKWKEPIDSLREKFFALPFTVTRQ